MSGFNGLKAIREAYDAGQTWYTTWVKRPTQNNGAQVWLDFSMYPGLPVANYYASLPGAAAVLDPNSGIYHGPNVWPQKKFLKSINTFSTHTYFPSDMILLDYLMYYPFLDMGTLDDQNCTNLVSLPRYTDGKNVKVMAVLTNPQIGSSTRFYFTYTNDQGVAGRVSATVQCNTSTVFGSIINSANVANTANLFIPLQAGDTGIRSIQKFNIISGLDVGLICLVLVMPLASFTCFDNTASTETDFLTSFPSMPVIQDGAYLNFILNPRASLQSTYIFGETTFIWS